MGQGRVWSTWSTHGPRRGEDELGAGQEAMCADQVRGAGLLQVGERWVPKPRLRPELQAKLKHLRLVWEAVRSPGGPLSRGIKGSLLKAG